MLDNKLLTFLSLCQTKSFTKTAELLHITQPAVSQQIKALEEKYKTNLYNYAGREVNLTPAGLYLFQFANSMYLDSLRVQDQLTTAGSEIRELRLGAELSTGESFLPELLVAFIKENPTHNISVLVENSATLSRKLEDGELDFLIIDESFSKAEFEYYPVCSGTTVCVCASEHPLAGKEVKIDELYDNNLILAVKGTPSRRRLETIFHENGISAYSFPHRIEISNSLTVVKQLIRNNIGIAFHYHSAVARELKNGYFKQIHIRGFFEKHSYNLVAVRNSYFRPSQVSFIQFCQDFLHKMDFNIR